MDMDATPEELRAVISRLEARERELEERLSLLEQQVGMAPRAQIVQRLEGAPTAPPVLALGEEGSADRAEEAPSTAPDRRQLFKKAGVMAAGTIAAGSVLAVAGEPGRRGDGHGQRQPWRARHQHRRQRRRGRDEQRR